MSFDVKTNPAQYQHNTLMIPVNQSGNGADLKKVLMEFRCLIATGTLATLDRVTIAGSVHTFPAAYATTTAAGLALIKQALLDIIETLLGTTNGDIALSLSGTTLIIRVGYTELLFQSIGVSGTSSIFAPVAAKVTGLNAADVGGFAITSVLLNAAGTDYVVKIKPFMGQDSGTVIVDYAGSTDEYNDTYPTPANALPAGTTLVNGEIIFEVVKATGDAAGTLVVSVTPLGGTIKTYSQSVILANYVI